MAADARPRLVDVLRPAFTSELLHLSRDLVVIVPPAARAELPVTVPDERRVVRE